MIAHPGNNPHHTYVCTPFAATNPAGKATTPASTHIAATIRDSNLDGLIRALTAIDMTKRKKSGHPLGWTGFDQTLPKISVPLVPPKPKLFFIAYSIGMARAVLAQ